MQGGGKVFQCKKLQQIDSTGGGRGGGKEWRICYETENICIILSTNDDINLYSQHPIHSGQDKARSVRIFNTTMSHYPTRLDVFFQKYILVDK